MTLEENAFSVIQRHTLINGQRLFQVRVGLSSVVVNVSAFGLWQMILGTKRRQVKTIGSTLRDLIDTLNDLSMGKLVEEVLVSGHGLDPKFKIFVNGNMSDSLSTRLTDGDEVLLFSVIDGG
jgi:molybdopterin converting factor small subunit